MTQTSQILTSTSGTGGFLDPESVVQQFDLKPGDHVADFGSGHGYFTIPVARIVGNGGKVYALDIQKSVLDTVRAKARLEHLLNIEYVWADLETPDGSKLKDRFVDFVITSNVFFQAENKETFMNEAYRILRDGGRFAVIEWTSEASLGPPRSMRVDKNDLLSLAQKSGFQLYTEFDAGTQHYGLMFKK